jgi:hypothetical protein
MLDDSVVVELARVPVRRGRYDCDVSVCSALVVWWDASLLGSVVHRIDGLRCIGLQVASTADAAGEVLRTD